MHIGQVANQPPDDCKAGQRYTQQLPVAYQAVITYQGQSRDQLKEHLQAQQ